jgi:hypothetical protein
MVGWTPCMCDGPGNLRVHCAEPGCYETWYDPPHDPAKAPSCMGYVRAGIRDLDSGFN